jgi:hypothetical protein
MNDFPVVKLEKHTGEKGVWWGTAAFHKKAPRKRGRERKKSEEEMESDAEMNA